MCLLFLSCFKLQLGIISTHKSRLSQWIYRQRMGLDQNHTLNLHLSALCGCFLATQQRSFSQDFDKGNFSTPLLFEMYVLFVAITCQKTRILSYSPRVHLISNQWISLSSADCEMWDDFELVIWKLDCTWA